MYPPPALMACLDLLLQCCYTGRARWCMFVLETGRGMDLTLLC